MENGSVPLFAIEDYTKVGNLFKPQKQVEHKALHPDCAFVSPKVILISFPSMWRWMRKGTITLGMVCMSLNMAEAAGRLPIGKTIKGLTH